jgi:nucleoside-diphosphate-sugar epimerase
VRVLLTGATGFIGGALAGRLQEAGHALVLPSRDVRAGLPAGAAAPVIPPLEAMTLGDWRPLLDGVDAVIHAAAIAHIGPDVPEAAYAAVNRDASARLAEAARQAGVRRFVFLSSVRAQVGPTSRAVQDERTSPAPSEPYGASKLEAERLISAVFPAATHVRPALVAGGAPKGNLALLAKLAATGLPLPFKRFNAPQATVSRENLIDAVLLALGSNQMTGETYVVADEPHPTIADMLRWLREGMGRPARLFSAPEALVQFPAMLASKTEAFERLTGGLRVDSAKLRAAGWKPRQPIADVFREIGRSSASGR